MEIHLDKHITKEYGRNKTLNFYDVTNYYFEIPYDDENEGSLRKTGLGKDKKFELPIVQMGLLIDNNGIPITHKIFPGNTADISTLISAVDDIKKSFNSEKIILTADKGLNSGGNLAYLIENNNGYIVSQKIRGSNKKFKGIVLDEEGYEYNKEKTFKVKSFIQTRTIKYTKTNSEGEEEKLSKDVTEKVVCLWSKNFDSRSKKERNKLEKRIDDLINRPDKLKAINKKGIKKYIIETEVNKETGEFEHTETIRTKDTDKLLEEEKFDGYYAIISSELELSSSEIIEKYRGLWRIEESFRIMKSDFDARPVYLRNTERIKAHFMICFLGLLILRILQLKTNFKYSSAEIITSLNEANVCYLEKGIYAVIRPKREFYLKLEEIFEVDFNVDYIKREHVNAKKRNITEHI